MLVNLKKIGNNNSKNIIIDPAELFNALSKEYKYLRDVQSQVLSEWFLNRDKSKDSVIKMNTGSGKTLVSLLILKSSLNEKKGPAVYVVPNNFLKVQVLSEAKKLGIEVTENYNSVEFYSGKSILVINPHQLFNGKSKLKSLEIGTILFDDVHAVLSMLESQFTIKIPRGEEAYEKIVKLFKEDLLNQDELKYHEFECDRLESGMLVPFWSWQKKNLDVFKILLEEEKKEKENKEKEKNVFFKIDLIKEDLKYYECVIDKYSIEITFDQVPVDVIGSYNSAKRRIFTTATLANEGLLLSHFNLQLPEQAITPRLCSDIGERMILIPKLINPNLADAEIKKSLKEKSKKYNVVVLVPSYKKANEWKEYADKILKEDISTGIDELKRGHVGLVVLVNRYEGIDLPNDACRILIIDDLPNVERKYSELVEGILRNNINTISNNIQKVEQGMGRGVRSRDDYCVVVLLGDILTDLITRNFSKLENLFSIATLTQFMVSNQLMDELKEKEIGINQLEEVMDYCLERNEDWIESLKGALAEKSYQKDLKIHESTKIMREAYNLIKKNKIYDAIKKMIDYVNNDLNGEEKGYLLQKISKYQNITDEVEAQVMLGAANNFSKLLVNPIEGIKKQRSMIQPEQQVDNIINMLMEIGINNYIIRLNAIRSVLNFEHTKFNEFEEGIRELGEVLGYPSNRPDKNKGKGPDNLWALNSKHYLVIECKNESRVEYVSKEYCNQLSGSKNWFNEVYNFSKEFKGVPIIIHPSNKVTREAYPDKDMRCIDAEKLKEIKGRVEKFGKNLSTLKNFDKSKVGEMLRNYKLDSASFIQNNTKEFIKE